MKWPCERRDAHKPHPRTKAGLMSPAASETNAVAYWLGDGTKTPEKICPGVKAHPNTMIGRAQDFGASGSEERKEER